VAFIFHLNKSRKRSLKSPIIRAIVRREQFIIDVFLSIMPESVFRSPTRSDTAEGAQVPSRDGHLSFPTLTHSGGDLNSISTKQSQTSSHIHNPLVRVAPVRIPAIRISPCGSDYRSVHLSSTNTGVTSSGSGRDSLQLPRAREEDGDLLLRENLTLVRSRSDLTARSNSRRLGRIGRLWSVDSFVVPSTSDSHAILEMEEGLRRSRSVESFPGRFPISDGVDAGSMRGRGATTVRPFTDL
jgi:hypothetical protein